MPTLQQLKYLVAVADHLHFRRAAEACKVTQPTLSAQLKELEGELGVQLVERSRSRVVITPLGRRVIDKARDVLRNIAEIEALAKTSEAMLEDMIKIGVVQSLGSYFLPLIVPDLHKSHPKLRLYMREGLPDMLLRGLEEGALDLLFFPLPLGRADLSSIPVFREPLLVVAPHDHPVAKMDRFDPALMKDENILTLEPGHKLYEQVRALCDDFGARLSRDYEGTSLDTLRQMVAMGMGLSLLPALYVKSEVAHQDIVVARRFRGKEPSRTIGMVWRKGTAREDEYMALAALIRGILRRRASEVTVVT
ncbi:LysR substrate-binding domain-containing protein [Litoreibacter roseus]|uniref:Hyaluronan synthase n=1 Tax=Litoreibacter roseus TaxID=2601869 RepID=A0A6N6JDC2_9RHOB|nr:LysR substrate-binding domain-containing protein [Litoreibacter roseus]GFE64176.1 hyaluronan synthase [Litoreibacter roseus]